MRAVNLTNLGFGLGGKHSAERRPIHAAGRHNGRGSRVPLERTGKLVFYTGSTPVAGEQIAVSYRTIGRAVGRAVNTASQQALAAGGIAIRGRVDRLGDQSRRRAAPRIAATPRW